jgi:SET domain-containing protein
VFTAAAIPAGSIIEVCPVIILPPDELPHIHQTRLHDYYFLWNEGDDPDEDGCAIALGFGSLYNHASRPNADYEMDYDNESISFFALTDIGAGEEITINYTDGGDQKTTLWFEEK